MANNATRANLPDYQYNLYNDYLDQLGDILIKYGQANSMPVQYWHIRVDLSKNFDDLKIQNAYKHYVYDLFHFIPTINATPINYQIGYNQPYQGTSNVGSGSLSMYLLHQPLPGDLFRYYPQDNATDTGEIFRVTNVRYMRTSKNKLKLYQLDFETAPILMDTLDHVRINSIQCWNSELYRFLTEEECNAMPDIIDGREEIIDKINDWYDEQHGWYGKCQSGTDPDNPIFDCAGDQRTRPFVFLNTVLKRLKKCFSTLDIKPIYGTGTATIPINWVLQTGDYWDTFTCLSFQPTANAGEIFNVTAIVNDQCTSCPPELVSEVKCNWELYLLIKELAELLIPLLNEEQLQDTTCDRNCCNATDPHYIQKCILNSSLDFDELFWDGDGPGAGENAKKFCERYENAPCIPLYISWRDGAHWPEGGLVP